MQEKTYENTYQANLEVDTQFKKPFIYQIENVSILFAVIEGFTQLTSTTPQQQLVKILNDLLTRFDKIAEVGSFPFLLPQERRSEVEMISGII